LARGIREGVPLIEGWVRQNMAVCVHCSAGLSRSASVVVAWLMRANRLNLASAVTLVTQRRGRKLQINPSFWMSLAIWERELLGLLPGTPPSFDFSAWWVEDFGRMGFPAAAIRRALAAPDAGDWVDFERAYDAMLSPPADSDAVLQPPLDGEGDAVPCFCYGSNSVMQLRERCQNSQLVAEAAYVPGVLRVFAGRSVKWADDGGEPGGVACLVPCGRPGQRCYGSIAWLTPAEYALLDPYEGIGGDPLDTDFAVNRYCRKWMPVVRVGAGGTEAPLQCIAYIRNKTDWEGFPSARYLAACHRTIGQFWPELDGDGTVHVHDGEGELRGCWDGVKSTLF
jgi:hypothetical protein